jgi:predicted acylesterase/phospholipase RssA
MDRPHSYLVISGGGSDGAFGAGLLCGWSDLGTRPEFQIVTGISTGALTAPFAFLGEDYARQSQSSASPFALSSPGGGVAGTGSEDRRTKSSARIVAAAQTFAEYAGTSNEEPRIEAKT